MSISSGKSVWSIKCGISGIVFKFKVISSPSSPFPLDKPLINLPDLYVREADIPSILGSALYSNSKFLAKFRKFAIFFQNLLNPLH